MAYTTSCAQNYKFAGMERDGETGNDHTWFRDYEQNLGRWMSPDLLAGDVTNPQSVNRYAYVGNRPTTLVDPLGLAACLRAGPHGHMFNALPAGCGGIYEGGGGGVSLDGGGTIPPQLAAELASIQTSSGGGIWAQVPTGVENVFVGWLNPQSMDIKIYDWQFIYSWIFIQFGSGQETSGGFGGGGGAGAIQTSAQQCVSNFYNTAAGKAVQFMSPLALVPNWNRNWPTTAGDWAEAILSKGASLAGFVQSGESITTVLGGTVNISSPLESLVGGALHVGEKVALPAMALAASADALAHGYCRAVEQGGLPNPFGN